MKPANPNITVGIDSDTSSNSHYQEILIGCLLAIIGNLMISVSLNVQKYAHNKEQLQQQASSVKHDRNNRHYLKQPLWWIGISLMAIGEVGNFAAYGFAPASVVAPLGTSTVIANMFIAVIFLRERLRPEDLFGSALAIVGAFLIVSFSKRKEHVLTAAQLIEALRSARFIVYITIELAILTVLFFMLYVMKRDNVLVLLLITSIIASFTVICAKGVSGLLNLTLSGVTQLTSPVFYIMGFVLCATAVLQVIYLNQAMQGSDSTVVVPTNFVFFTVSAITSGIVFFNEFWGLYSLSIFMFLLGCFLSFIGVYFITFNRGGHSSGDTIDDKTPIKAAMHSDTGDAASAASVAAADGDNEDRAQKILYDVFPSWLLASVNRAEVQPRRSHPQWTGPPERKVSVAADDAAAAAAAVSVSASDGDAGLLQAESRVGDQDELISK